VTVRAPAETFVRLAVDRFVRLLRPDPEPCPLVDGATPAEWAAAGGLGAAPHPAMGQAVERLDLGAHDPATIAHAALQRLCHRALVERVAGLPIRYRPVRRG
jgi:hypothetical protein